MDREFLKKHNLMQAHNQFMKLTEGYLSASINEAGENPQDDQMPPMDGPNQPPMGGPQDGQMPPGGDGQPPMGGPGDAGMPPMDGPQGGDPNQPPMDGPQDGQMPPMDDPNQPPMGGDMPPMGPIDGEGPQEKDDVLDVEDLTKAQEKLNNKENNIGKDLGKLDDRIESLLAAIEKMKGVIDHNNGEISNLKQELERRVPTQTERLNLRGLDCYPYNVKPTDYFQSVNQNGNYDVRFDNQQPTQKDLVLKNSDIDDYNDSEIEKSLNGDLDQSMEKIFRNFR